MFGTVRGVDAIRACSRRIGSDLGSVRQSIDGSTTDGGSRHAHVPTATGARSTGIHPKDHGACDGDVSRWSDGPIRGNGWHEVKSLVIGEVKPAPATTRKRDQHRRTSNHTVFSRLADAETFAKLCTGEISRRGIDQAPGVCAVQDGALWLQGFVDVHRHDAVRILDFAHASEYVHAIGEEVRTRGGHLPADWFEGVLHRLKHDGPTRVLKHLGCLVKRFGPSATLQSNLGYLLKREAQM